MKKEYIFIYFKYSENYSKIKEYTKRYIRGIMRNPASNKSFFITIILPLTKEIVKCSGHTGVLLFHKLVIGK